MRASGGDAQSAFDRVLPLRVRSKRILGTRRFDAALLGQAPQHLLVILAGIPPHQAAQRGILGRGINADPLGADRKSTRLNSSHMSISYAVFCLKKKKTPVRCFP